MIALFQEGNVDITGLLMILLAFARINLSQGHAPGRSHQQTVSPLTLVQFQVCTHDGSLFIDLFLTDTKGYIYYF